MEPVTILWQVRTNGFRYGADDAAALNVAVRGIYPGAPDIRQEHAVRLLSRHREVTVTGQDGSRLVLARGTGVSVKGGTSHTVQVSFEPGDYGLAEFDRIMLSLVHSAPVAAAVKAIQREERKLPAIFTRIPFRLGPLPRILRVPRNQRGE